MKQLSRAFSYFSKFELALWVASVVAITAAFCLFDGSQYLTLAASLIGVTSLIFNAKGNPFGQFLMVVFSLFYGYISFTYDYFGEMMTYLGMTMPMAAFALVSWLRHPYRGKKSEVEVNRLEKKEIVLMSLLTLAVTVAFYFILRHFHTANLLPSTLSVTTSFAAVYLTFRRSPYFAVLYAMNDVVLIVLWILASRENTAYVSVTVCFAAFLLNDAYGFYNWKRMERQQKAAPPDKS
ncbi:MAG: nicotinamide mononucleotide transporter [Ruminococcaceae bacterium]|nr:nicotinamide mononucleotide transporter [Oscillospiraceae bacterium]